MCSHYRIFHMALHCDKYICNIEKCGLHQIVLASLQNWHYFWLFRKCCIYLKDIVTKKERGRREREREYEIFHPALHSLKWPQQTIWNQTEVNNQEFHLGFFYGWQEPGYSEPSTAAFLGTWTRFWIGTSHWYLNQHSAMDCHHSKPWLITLCQQWWPLSIIIPPIPMG